MNFSITDEQRALCDQISDLAQSELNNGARERDASRIFARELWLRCGEMKLQGISVPVKYGGCGLNAVSTALALETLGKSCEDAGLVFAICAHMLACVVPISLYGSETQKKELLPDLSSGRLIGATAMTEANSGSDAFAMKTRAVFNGESFVIDGTKTFVSNGPLADVVLIYAATDPGKGFIGGVTAFLIRRGTPGFCQKPALDTAGLRSCQVGELQLDGVRVGKEAVLGSVGSGGPIFAKSMEWERSGLAAAHVGEIQRLMERAIKFAKTRKLDGKPIGRLQAVSHKIADMKVKLEAARLLTFYAAAQLDTGRGTGLSASIAKLFVSEALVHSTLDTIQILGGVGFLTESDVERVLRDSVGSTLYSGTSEIQRNLIARWLGL